MNARKSVTMLETVHGSHLYGLSRPESDLDTYRVVSNLPDADKFLRLKTRQRISGDDDALEINLTAFLLKAQEGVPQALEAMFSPVATGPLKYYADAYSVETARFASTYRRTVLNFARLGLLDDRAKEVIAPDYADEVSKKRVRESVRVQKPRRVERNGLAKYKKHALRLLLNREEGIKYGRFNPRLSEADRDFVLRCAELEDMKYALLIKSRLDFF